jgi:hypothetical protein
MKVVFLRKRTLGFNTAIEAVLEDLDKREQFSYALTSFVGATSQTDSTWQNEQRTISLSPNGEDEEILLSKPANAEQLEIAQRLKQCGAVLVQGPPGTGKTHTIANLLGHFLAEGKSVLVTSHTSKALRVLHEKIVMPLQPLCVSMLAERNRREYAANAAKLSELNKKLLSITRTAQSTPLFKRMHIAVDARNPTSYKECYEHIVALYECQKEQQDRLVLLSRLKKYAPLWADSIRLRDGIHGRESIPERIEVAWRDKQLKDELDRRARISLGDVQDRLTRLQTELHAVTAELVEKKAWAAQIRRTTLEQQRALLSWKELMRKIGKGGGKRAPQQRAEARGLMPVCQTAIPVWIMPLNLVVQNFDPRKNHFDVIIIDEASQADIKALTAIYMGTQIIIVGDDEQVTPLAVGQSLDNVGKLIREHLQDIPSKELYDGKLSIYALAKTTFKLVCLREHFRYKQAGRTGKEDRFRV